MLIRYTHAVAVADLIDCMTASIDTTTFPAFVNELATWIVNDMRMFADDTKLWCRIKKESDGVTLQQGIDCLSAWSNTWQLKLNVEKCKVMHIGHSYATTYYMTELRASKKLESDQERDQGITIVKPQIFATVHQGSSNCVTSDSNGEKELRTFGCERLQSYSSVQIIKKKYKQHVL